MRLCIVSRAANRRTTGRDEMICTSAFRSGHWSRHVLDVVLYLRDGPDHCLRMAALDDHGGWGWTDPVAPIRRAGL